MANRYWVDGGNSNFASTTNWSLESGGVSGASVPGAGDTAIFDANSGEGVYCEITSTVLCHLNTEAMPEGFEIDIGTDGNLSLQEEQTFYWLSVYSNGILTTNNFNITIRDYIDFGGYAVANLGTSIITINCESGEGGLYVTEDVTFDADEATIIINDSLSSLENQCFIAVYNQVIANLQINFIGGACIQFDGDNTFYSLSITGDGLLWFVDWGAEGTIETVINTLELEGDTPGGLLLGSEPPYLWAFVKTTGEVNAVNCTIMNSIATGGAVFNAFTTNGNIDGGNNTGWDFGESGPSIVSIAVTPVKPVRKPDRHIQFTAIATYDDETTADVTEDVYWSSSDEGVATIDEHGYATTIAQGITAITASTDPPGGVPV